MNKEMKVQILGSGCPNCRKLYETTKKVAVDLGLKAKVEYIDDITKIIELGIMTSPVLVIDGKVILTGSAHSEGDIANALKNNNTNDSADSGCCCGHQH
ncbi:MAG: thioredoxin family protein [bacterium]|nr:thioredoxin family protein [bacterium]